MPSFLLELFSEEIPARMQFRAGFDLARFLDNGLKEAGINIKSPAIFVTPRRVAVRIENIPAQQPDVTIEKKGPKTSAPQAAIDGFLKSSGLTLNQCEKRMVGKDEVYFAVVHQKGQPTANLLKAMIEKILAEFPWTKSMRWGSGETRWVRPLHSILCLFDGKVVPVEFAGVKAGNVTYGHRFLAPAAITITDPAEYEAKLKAAYVIADRDARKDEIQKQANDVAAQAGLQLNPDQDILDEVTGLVEWPTVIIASIDAKYMDLPPEVLVSEMRAHQKYFALNRKDGSFCDKFLITSNMITSDGGKAVVAGNERVLRARLADGRFFWDQDRKKPLSAWAEGLQGVTFHAKIGSMAQKVERIRSLALKLAPVANADATLTGKAADLCKADLVTGMVGEFPELQGVMGRYYALQQKEDAQVANAIRDHYLPLGPDSPVPTEPVAICIALADKFDTLMEMFRAGEKPTGSKDPFALRRSALGVIRIILENNLRLPLKMVLNDELLAFFCDRLKVMLKDQGIRHDVINAVMAGGDDDLVRVVAKAKALQAFLATQDGANLLAGYRRAGNIVAAEEKKEGKTFETVDDTLFEATEEKLLNSVLATNAKTIDETVQSEDYARAMLALAAFRQPVDAFFDKVMVNVDKPGLRATRLGLLNSLRHTMHLIADFSKIEG